MRHLADRHRLIWPEPRRRGALYRRRAPTDQITDPLARATPDPAILIDAFDLTPSEAILAVELLCGLSVGEAAAKRGRSVATMRTHLASVLAKTGTARQSDLVRLLSRLPHSTAVG